MPDNLTMAMATVVSQVGDQYGVNVVLDGGSLGGQMPFVPVDVATHGPRDALRIIEHPLPSKGTRGIVVFPRGDSRNGVWIGSVRNTQNDASSFSPSGTMQHYRADYSGYWSLHDEAGNHTSVYPDGSYILIGPSGVPTVTRHTLDTNQKRIRTPFTQAQRVQTAPSGSFPFTYKQPTGATVSVSVSGAISVTSAPNQTLTFAVSGGASITLKADGGVEIKSAAGKDIIIKPDGSGKVKLAGASAAVRIAPGVDAHDTLAS